MEFRQKQGMINPMNENERNSSYPDPSKKLLNNKKKSTDHKAKLLRDTIRDFSQKVFSKIWMGCAVRRQACLGLPVAYRQVQQHGRSVLPYDLMPDLEKLVSISREHIKKPIISSFDGEEQGIEFINDYINSVYNKGRLQELINSSYRNTLMDGASFILLDNFNKSGDTVAEIIDAYSCFYEVNSSTENQLAFSKNCSFFFTERIVSVPYLRDLFGSSKKLDEALRKGFSQIDTCSFFKLQEFINVYQTIKITDGQDIKVDTEKFVNKVQKIGETNFSQAKYHRLFRKTKKKVASTTDETGKKKDVVTTYICEHFVNDVHVFTNDCNTSTLPVLPMFLTDCNIDSHCNIYNSLFDFLKNDLLLLCSLRSTMHNSCINGLNASVFIDGNILDEVAQNTQLIKNGIISVSSKDGKPLSESILPTPPVQINPVILDAIERTRANIYEKLNLITSTKNLGSYDQEALRKKDRSELNASILKCLDILCTSSGDLLIDFAIQSLKDFPEKFSALKDVSEEMRIPIIKKLKNLDLKVDFEYADNISSKERSIQKLMELNDQSQGQFPIQKSKILKEMNMDKGIVESMEKVEASMSQAQQEAQSIEIEKIKSEIQKNQAMAQKYAAEATKIQEEKNE